MGAKAHIGSDVIELLPSIKWYEVLMSILPFVLILIWGNSIALVNIIPVVGGAVGGAISGLLSMTNLLLIKGIKQIWLKIIISIAMLGATFLICYLVALAILS